MYKTEYQLHQEEKQREIIGKVIEGSIIALGVLFVLSIIFDKYLR